RAFHAYRARLSSDLVDGVFQLQKLALDVHRDLPRQVPARDRRRHASNVADLCGEVRRHRVDRVGQVLPRAGNARHHRLATKLAVGAHLAYDAGHLRGESTELIDHRVDGFLQLEDFAADV